MHGLLYKYKTRRRPLYIGNIYCQQQFPCFPPTNAHIYHDTGDLVVSVVAVQLPFCS